MDVPMVALAAALPFAFLDTPSIFDGKVEYLPQ
jgi:hypothetical protein